jgi:hypothetical protein
VVEEEITNFLWRRKKPKIKYKTLIGGYKEGGIRLPDFENIINANRVSWALKIINSKVDEYWKSFANNLFKPFGGINILDENIDPSWIIKLKPKFPAFYKEILDAWKKISVTSVNTVEDILRQPIWLNQYIHLDYYHINIKIFMEKNISKIIDVWDRKYGFKWDVMKTQGWRNQEYIVWRGIIDALPSEWKLKLKNNQQQNKPRDNIKYIEISEKLTPISKIKTKMIYWKLVRKKFLEPTSQKYISDKLHDTNIEWSLVYSSIYKTTIDTKLRAFQYKILNNCLYLNKDLHKFRKVESQGAQFR